MGSQPSSVCGVLSTAEGQLMSYLESMVMGDSLASLIEVVEGRKSSRRSPTETTQLQ